MAITTLDPGYAHDAIGVSCLSDDDARDLVIERTDGSYLSKHPDYAENCWLPRDKWQTLNQRDLEPLLHPLGALCPNSVTLLRIDQPLVDEFHNSIQLEPTGVLPLVPGTGRLEELVRLVFENLARRYCVERIVNRSSELTFSPPFMDTTAFNYDANVFMGMHIDNHDQLSLRTRREGFQLLNVNVGRADRHFCFVASEVTGLARSLEIDDDEFEKKYRFQMSSLKNLFLSTHPRYSVFRLRIPPGYAYVATTQNLIHDGMTNREGQWDVTLLLTGRFVAGREGVA